MTHDLNGLHATPFGYTLVKHGRRGKKNRKVDVLNEEIRTLREQVEQTELVADEIQASHRRLLSWADMFDTASIEEKKMIASYLIKAVSLTRDYGIQVEFNVSESRYLGGMEMR